MPCSPAHVPSSSRASLTSALARSSTSFGRSTSPSLPFQRIARWTSAGRRRVNARLVQSRVGREKGQRLTAVADVRNDGRDEARALHQYLGACNKLGEARDRDADVGDLRGSAGDESALRTGVQAVPARTSVRHPLPINNCCDQYCDCVARGEHVSSEAEPGRLEAGRTLRAFHNSSFSFSSLAILSSRAPARLTMVATASRLARLTASLGLEKRMSTVGSSGSASGRSLARLRPRIEVPSRSSSDVGVSPAPRISTTAVTASATEGNEVRATLSGTTGARRMVNSVMICEPRS